MNLYQKQHRFYCGVDLHAKQMHACVVDSNGDKKLHQNFATARPQELFDRLKPFQEDLVLGCECTFNWYWLADYCESQDIEFVLGHALYLRAIHGGKVKNDKIDSEKLAYLLRGGNFATAYTYPKHWRSTRDLLRRRAHFVRRRGETLAHIVNTHSQYNIPTTGKRMQYKANRAGVPELFPETAVQKSIQVDMDMLASYDEVIRGTELYLQQSCKVHDPQNFYLLQTIPGVGRIIAMTLLYEIHDIRRFPSLGNFLSYSRLVRGNHSSAGKNYGSPGKKIGNAYLKWAFGEIVPLIKRQCTEAKLFIERIEKRHGKARAHSRLAVKLGRAVYFMLRRGEVFDLGKLLR